MLIWWLPPGDIFHGISVKNIKAEKERFFPVNPAGDISPVIGDLQAFVTCVFVIRFIFESILTLDAVFQTHQPLKGAFNDASMIRRKTGL